VSGFEEKKTLAHFAGKKKKEPKPLHKKKKKGGGERGFDTRYGEEIRTYPRKEKVWMPYSEDVSSLHACGDCGTKESKREPTMGSVQKQRKKPGSGQEKKEKKRKEGTRPSLVSTIWKEKIKKRIGNLSKGKGKERDFKKRGGGFSRPNATFPLKGSLSSAKGELFNDLARAKGKGCCQTAPRGHLRKST